MFSLSKWQLSWDRATFSKLHEIKPVHGKNTMYRSLRREEVVLTRLRIGYTRLTHSYLFKREDQPFCTSCNEPFTVKHFLVDCIEFSHVRGQFFQTNDLMYLFENVPADNILVFLKHINLFNKEYCLCFSIRSSFTLTMLVHHFDTNDPHGLMRR